MSVITVDLKKNIGKIKPLHGVNNSPLCLNKPLPEFQDAGIPFVRTHDTAGAYGGSHYVDIPNIFPDFDADPALPESYDFAFTDAYLKGLMESGCKIFYRLGTTIENNWRIKAYNIHPPKDFKKWARICEGVVRHYNEGWANGFHFDIEYWEVWNEPENPPMWTGTREEFFELYRITANHLKKHFPHLKIGGYAGCGFYAITRENMSDFFKSFITYYDEFLKYVTAQKTSAPLDFFSWHLYGCNIDELITHAEYATSKLREYGLDHVENIFNEWNYANPKDECYFDTMKEMPGATFVAGSFCRMQNSVVDKAMFYDAYPSRRYCALYYFPSLRLTKTYYAFKAFNELYKLGDQVQCDGANNQIVYALAASKGADSRVLLVNRGSKKTVIELQIDAKAKLSEVLLLDKKHDFVPVQTLNDGNTVTLPAMSLVLLNYSTGKKSAKITKTVKAKDNVKFAGLG